MKQMGIVPPRANTAANAKNNSFDSIKQIDAGLLNVGYAEAGPANDPAVILLHGWPYDIHGYVDAAPLLASAFRSSWLASSFTCGYASTSSFLGQ